MISCCLFILKLEEIRFYKFDFLPQIIMAKHLVFLTPDNSIFVSPDAHVRDDFSALRVSTFFKDTLVSLKVIFKGEIKNMRCVYIATGKNGL